MPKCGELEVMSMVVVVEGVSGGGGGVEGVVLLGFVHTRRPIRIRIRWFFLCLVRTGKCQTGRRVVG